MPHKGGGYVSSNRSCSGGVAVTRRPLARALLDLASAARTTRDRQQKVKGEAHAIGRSVVATADCPRTTCTALESLVGGGATTVGEDRQ
ncbi:hypothetical protein MRX96_059225 [Rhipicephalus microplus]